MLWNIELVWFDDDDNDDDESFFVFWGRRFLFVIIDGCFVLLKEFCDIWCCKYIDDYEVIFVFLNIVEKVRDFCYKLFLWKSILFLYFLEIFVLVKVI